MQESYDVMLTPTAKRSYLQFPERALPHLEKGHVKHPAVVAFNAVENAIDVTLANNPCDSSKSLAGVLDVIYRLPLGSISISYVVMESKPSVIVLTISETERSAALRRWLTNAIKNGEADELLERLGIEKPCLKIEIDSDWLH